MTRPTPKGFQQLFKGHSASLAAIKYRKMGLQNGLNSELRTVKQVNSALKKASKSVSAKTTATKTTTKKATTKTATKPVSGTIKSKKSIKPLAKNTNGMRVTKQLSRQEAIKRPQGGILGSRMTGVSRATSVRDDDKQTRERVYNGLKTNAAKRAFRETMSMYNSRKSPSENTQTGWQREKARHKKLLAKVEGMRAGIRSAKATQKKRKSK